MLKDVSNKTKAYAPNKILVKRRTKGRIMLDKVIANQLTNKVTKLLSD